MRGAAQPDSNDDGNDKVIAAAHYIVNSLTVSPDSAEDMMKILSSFDNRLSGIFTRSGTDNPEESSLADTEVIIRLQKEAGKEFYWEKDGEGFLSAVDDAMSLAASAVSVEVRCRAEVLLQDAMSRLEEEFFHLMTRNSTQLDDLISNNDRPNSIVLPDALAGLKNIADRMILSGYTKELCQTYNTTRHQILDGYISGLGIVRFTIDEVRKMDIKALDEKMKRWASAMRMICKNLLVLERKLCDHVFSGAEGLRDESFLESTRGCTMQLLNFGDAVAISQSFPEKLCGILDMYDSLSNAKPELHLLFSGDSGKPILDEAENVLKSLQTTAVRCLSEFGDSLQKGIRPRPLPFGGLHPTATYVLNYVRTLVDYRSLLDSVLGESREIVDSDSLQDAKDKDITPFVLHLQNLFLNLDSAIVEDSKLYEDEALQYVFLMNNTLYIAKGVKDSAIRVLLGDYWVRKMKGRVRQYSMGYLRVSWIKALSFLKVIEFGCSGSSQNSSNAAIKDKFKSFNLAFEEIYRTQNTWLIPDTQLREELRISISESVLPAYRFFWAKYGGLLDRLRHPEKYAKYAPEDIENLLHLLFEGPTQCQVIQGENSVYSKWGSLVNAHWK